MDENFEQEKIQPKSSLKSSPITMALIALGTVFVLYQFFGAGLALLLFGELDKKNVQGFRLITMFSQFMFILVPTLLFARWQETKYKEIFKIKTPTLPEIILTIIGTLSLQNIAQIYLYIQDILLPVEKLSPIFETLRKMMEQTYSILISARSPIEFAFVVLVVAFTPAVCEELLFRGLVQYNISKASNYKLGFVITGAIFAMYHINPFSFIPLIALGVYFGYLVYKSGSIYLSMIAHFINNFSAAYFYYAFGKEGIITVQTSLLPMMAFFSIAIFVGSIYAFEVIHLNKIKSEN
ncbi:MAG: CPBP family intramembrane glutamic endopeptidase [Candidatus Kryptonium sp.]